MIKWNSPTFLPLQLEEDSFLIVTYIVSHTVRMCEFDLQTAV